MTGRVSSFALLMVMLVSLVATHSSTATSLTENEPRASSLYAVWANWNGQFNISTINPNTGVAGPYVYAGQLWQVWSITPAVDNKGKRMFIPTNGPGGGLLAVFDVSDPNKMVLAQQIAFPGNYFWGVEYDSASNRVWAVSCFLSSSPGAGAPAFLVSIDLAQGTARNVTNLPVGEIPSAFDIGGGPLVLDEKNRVLVIPTMKNPNQPTMSFSLTKFDIDKEQYLNAIPLQQLYPSALARDRQSGTVYGLFSSVARDGLSFGVLNPVAGTIKVINHWNSTKLQSVIGSLSSIDPSAGRFYSVIGSGGGPPVALVAVSTTTGTIVAANYFLGKQAQALFVLE